MLAGSYSVGTLSSDRTAVSQGICKRSHRTDGMVFVSVRSRTGATQDTIAALSAGRLIMNRTLHWKTYKASNVLKNAINSLKSGGHIDTYDRAILSIYFQSWLDHNWGFVGDFAEQLTALKQSMPEKVLDGDRQTIEQWLKQLAEIGIDPI